MANLAGKTQLSAPYHNKALPEGTILREWRLDQVLGAGGFGIVYRAKGIYFDEVVAIKEYFPGAISDRQDGTTVTPTDSSSEETYVLGKQKFIEEAKVLWNLSKPERHPNIVSVRSLFEIHGTAYMVMDFETGVSLSQMLRDGRQFDEESLLKIIRPIAEGLDRAHRAGVLHRDIKPANILVDDTGRPVLIDFGSARFDSGQATNTKVTFYTPPYAAIEQYVKTYPQGPWTDIYALGVALYQCIVGEKPPEVLERLHGELDEPLSTREWPGFSRAFIRAVDAAMAIRPVERPQSIPTWLKMFEAVPPANEDEATRVRVAPVLDRPTAGRPIPSNDPQPIIAPTGAGADRPPASPPMATSGPLPPVEQAGPAADSAVSYVPKGRPRNRHKVVGVVAAGILILGAGAAALTLWPRHQTGGDSKPLPVTPLASAPAVGRPDLGQEAGEIVEDAQKVGRPQKEIASLTEAKNKIAALDAQLKGLPPGAASTETAPVVTQLNETAAEMSRSEVTVLDRAAKAQWKDVEQPLSQPVSAGASAAVAKVREAKTGLDASIAAVSQKNDAAGSIEGIRNALTAYGTFATAYAAVVPFYIPEKQKEFAAMEASARLASGKVVAFASASKPWLFASQARKDAYKLLQDNAAQATAQTAQLNTLSQSAASSASMKQLNAALTQGSKIAQSLNDLYAKSSAASAIVTGNTEVTPNSR